MATQKNRNTNTSLKSFRVPVTIWLITLTFMSFFVLQFNNVVQPLTHKIAASIADDSYVIQAGILIGGTLMEILLIWIADWLIKLHPFVLFGAQLAFALSTTLAFSGDMPVFIIGIFPVITIETINLYHHPKPIVFAIGLLYFGAWIPYSLANGWFQGVIVLQSMVFMLCVLLYYWNFYAKQVAEKNRAEDLVTELKVAYAQVEEATIRTERQRVARELHDTLTQGLAGTVMQLEAAKSFLASGKTEKTAQVIDNTIEIARDTLRDSRLTLTDLRSTTEESLEARVNLLLDAFKKNYGLNVHTRLQQVPEYSNAQLTQITRIISEALVNVVKHTNDQEAVIQGRTTNDVFTLKVIDFETDNLATAKESTSSRFKKTDGHFGMQGMHERAAALDGILSVVSNPEEGTTVTLTIPTARKEKLWPQKYW